MYCIKIKADTENYLCNCVKGSFVLCRRKDDAKKFESLRELLADASRAGLKEEHFEVVSEEDNEGKESAVFGNAEKGIITFERLAEICDSGTAISKLNPGDKVENGYVIVAVKPDAVKIWSVKDNRGDMNWKDAKSAAENYCYEWDDSGLPVVATGSELLSKEEVNAMQIEDRETGFYYWASTEYISGYHCYVNSDGSLHYSFDGDSLGCCPGIWVRSRTSSGMIDKNREDVITFERLHEICEECSADLALKPGDKLEEEYVVVAVKPDAVKVWSPKNFLGDMNWQGANKAADNYYRDWNEDGVFPVEAISSELLSKEEVDELSEADRTTGFDYWASAGYSSGNHWCVNSDGSVYSSNDGISGGCCPGIWVK